MTELFLALLNRSIAAGWLILVVLVLRLLLQKAPKRIRCALWALVGVRLVCPFSLQSAFSLIPSSEPIPPDIAMSQNPAVDLGVPAVNRVINPVITYSFQPDPFTSANPLQLVLPVLAALWLVGAAAMLLYALVSFLRLRRTVSASLCREDGVMVCDDIASPFLLGILNPRIYLPSSLRQPAFGFVLMHERTHLRRRDHWWKLLGWLVLSVYWFHPLCWLAYVLLCRDIELACDEAVIRTLDEDGKVAYSQALLDCSAVRGRGKHIAACPVAFGEVGVKQRVQSVLRYHKPAAWLAAAAVLALAAAAVCFLTDPLEREADLSLLNYKNALSAAAEQEELSVIYCPSAEEDESSSICLGTVRGSALAQYLDAAEWKQAAPPRGSLPSPGSVEFVLEEDYRITVYQSPRRARVACAEGQRYYAIGRGDYEAAVQLLQADGAEAETQAAPQIIKWFDGLHGDELLMYGAREYDLDEFPGVTFRWTPERLEAVTAEDRVPLFYGSPILSIYFCDLTGDGAPELCATLGGGDVEGSAVLVYDYAGGASYGLAEPETFDISLNGQDGRLLVEKRAIGQAEVIQTAELVYRDGTFQLVATAPFEWITYTIAPGGSYIASNGVTYHYLLTLTGRMPGASADSQFIVLSNNKDLAFERVAESLFTSNTERFLDAEEAVVVGLGTAQPLNAAQAG